MDINTRKPVMGAFRRFRQKLMEQGRMRAYKRGIEWASHGVLIEGRTAEDIACELNKRADPGHPFDQGAMRVVHVFQNNREWR